MVSVVENAVLPSFRTLFDGLSAGKLPRGKGYPLRRFLASNFLREVS
jgi:hypothetical protein